MQLFAREFRGRSSRDWVVAHALKESVVRLHVRAKTPLPLDVPVPQRLTYRVEGNRATIAVADWSPARRDALAAELNADVDVEPLGLEEIFIELHK